MLLVGETWTLKTLGQISVAIKQATRVLIQLAGRGICLGWGFLLLGENLSIIFASFNVHLTTVGLGGSGFKEINFFPKFKTKTF